MFSHLIFWRFFQRKAHQANVDAQELAHAVEEGDLEHEVEEANKEEADADQLDQAVRKKIVFPSLFFCVLLCSSCFFFSAGQRR